MRATLSFSKSLALLVVILLCSGPLLNCECSEPDRFGPPQLQVDATVLQFDDVAVGYAQTRILLVSNLGGSGLLLEQVAVANAAGPFSVLGVDGPDGMQAIPDFVAPAETIRLVVQYDPATEDAVDHDALQLLTNDPDECNPEDLTENPCEILLTGTGAPPEAILDVVCLDDEKCPPPNDTPVCQVMMDQATNSQPERLSLNFCEVTKGYSRSLRARLRNTGNIPLSMTGFEFFTIVGDGGFALLAPEEKDIEIAPGGDQILEIIYAPSAEGTDNVGIDTITNTDIDDAGLPVGEFTVRMLAYSAEADISVYPSHIPFEGVMQGETVTEDITVTNTGTGTLSVTEIEITGGSADGEFSLESMAPFTVSGIETATISVIYHPQDALRDDGSVIIRSNDPDENPVVITLGADVRPDLEVNPEDTVRFVGIAPGGSGAEDVVLRNVGYAELTITDIVIDPALNPGNPPVFALADLPPGFPASPLVLPPAASHTFTVSFLDNMNLADEVGQIEITHDSPSDSVPYRIILKSEGTPANLPPVAIIDPPVQTVQGLAEINLDGSSSFDPDDGDVITRYQWSFLFLPQDAQGNQSQSTLSTETGTQTSFVPDIAGTYIVRLVVYDLLNVASQPIDSEISVNP